ncbi:glycosyltransferase [Cylindrospermopsis raciborskii CHAB3438]|jgi:glycosyltransferase involved in cell wall biosynthesis|uniref:glycosyltransferase family 2 protein n=1 Tax=Cylindrospermopsis raciborskii TaxID=77022 RepID=UPI001F0CFB4C|nr:glycosyltransferase family A protein [Cylindrospermopsis raciborskii]MCH4903616.1 glycosyltransferase [Cylindrospermopsis raciborskii CHAB3438]
MPKFTIITACYNAEKFISKAIETIRAQTFTDWEYIVIDDGSTDNSAEIISSYKKLEPRLKLIKQSNSGMCIARNNGFKASYQESQYLLFFDADDCLEPQMLEVMINYLNAHPDIGAAYCDFYNIDADDKPINTVYTPRLIPSMFGVKTLPYNTPETPLVAIAGGLGGGLDGRTVFRRSIYEQTSGWDEKLGRNGGHILDILAQVALISQVHFVPEKLHKYRLHSGGQLHVNVNCKGQSEKIINKWKNYKQLNAQQQKQVSQAIYFHEKRLTPLVEMLSASQLIKDGKIISALRLYFQAAKNYVPSLFFHQ